MVKPHTQRWRPRVDVLLLLFSLVICIWLGTRNYSLHALVQEKDEEIRQTHDNTQTHILRIDKQLTQLHTHANTIKTDYTSLQDLLQATLKKQAQEVGGATQKLSNTEYQLNEARKTISNLEKKNGELVASMPVDHKDHLAKAGARFKSGTISVTVIVALDWWGDSKGSVHSLSILYILDYFNNVARKENINIEIIFVHPATSTTLAPEFILTHNLVSEFKKVESGSLESMLNEAAQEAKGNYLLFIPLLPSKSAQLDITLSIDVKKMLEQFKDTDVGIVGGIVVHSENDTLINAGIDFARTTKDAVTPFARYVGAGLHYPKKAESAPCVSRWGMMIERNLFAKVGGFEESFTVSGESFPVTQLMEDSDLCLRVITHSKKIIYIPESSVKTGTLPEPSYYYARHIPDLLLKFDKTWAAMVRSIIDAKKVIQNFMLVWDLYCGCTGVNVEAINYLVALENKLDVGAVAGESCWCGGFPTYVHESLLRISSRVIGPKVDVWVSHKPPDKYPSFPYNGLVVVKDRPARIIGRSMSETDTIKKKWVESSSKADEIWVPTEFHREVFTVSGVESNKLTVIEESLDTTLYDPANTQPLPLDPRYNSAFKFLSVFKWETRKGWDVLLQAYFEEFVGEVDDVVLVLQTYLYGEKYPRDRKKVENKIKTFAESLGLKKQFPPVLVLTDELPEMQMPQLYKACDAFVLPTRGEGWGLPVMEAMSMSLPSIVTNWSGPTQFTTKDTSYLLSYDALETVPYSFEAGSGVEKWAKPSLSELKELMRSIYTHPKKAKEVGERARKHIVENYDREIIAKKMVERLKEIQKTMSK